ncbi:MAG: sulfurtransferase-like selenium metabolism protein YedF [Bacteroidales bacterium]|jgi:selenium metabolism protein YedF|nr:sulfurtransferase-like selenium metabolism protein YedF [Bacteroidales bacterium]
MIVDTKGQLCPKPLILTRKAIKEAAKGTDIEVICDNDIAFKNVCSYLNDQKIEINTESDGNEFRIKFNTSGDTVAPQITEEYCPVPEKNELSNTVITVKSNKMGEGDPELGEILIKAFINTISELDRLPSHVIFYNSGVKLTTQNSGVTDALKELNNSGVKIIVCGTCVDFYDIKDKVEVGTISNMYTISDIMDKAAKIVIP